MADIYRINQFELEDKGDCGTIKIKTRSDPKDFILHFNGLLSTLPPDDQESVKLAIMTGNAIKIRNPRLVENCIESIKHSQVEYQEWSAASLTYAKTKSARFQRAKSVHQNSNTGTLTIELTVENQGREPLTDVCLKDIIKPGFQLILASSGGEEVEEDGQKKVMWKWNVLLPHHTLKVKYEIVQVNK